MTDSEEKKVLRGKIEAILFVAGDSVALPDLAKALQTEVNDLEYLLNDISNEYDYEQRGFVLRRFGDRVQLATRAQYAPDVVRLLQPVQQQ